METLKRVACWFGIGVDDAGVCEYLNKPRYDTAVEEPYDAELEGRVEELEIRVSLVERRQDIRDKREVSHV